MEGAPAVQRAATGEAATVQEATLREATTVQEAATGGHRHFKRGQ